MCSCTIDSSGDIQRGSVAIRPVPRPWGRSGRPAISADGLRVVTFESDAENLVVRRHESWQRTSSSMTCRRTQTTPNVSVDSAGVQGNLFSEFPERGRQRAGVSTYHALANNLVVSTMSTRTRDVFLHDRGAECDVNAAVHQFVLPVNQWRTLTLPCDPPPGTTLADLFGDDIAGNYASAMPERSILSGSCTPTMRQRQRRAYENRRARWRTDRAGEAILDHSAHGRGRGAGSAGGQSWLGQSTSSAGQACTSELGCQERAAVRPTGRWL